MVVWNDNEEDMNIGIDGRILDWKYSGIAKYVQLMLTFEFLRGATIYFPGKTTYQSPDGFHKKVLNSPFRRRELYEQFILPFHLAKDRIDLFIQPYNFGIPLLYFGKSILIVFDTIPLIFKNYFYYAKFPKWAKWNYEMNTRFSLSYATKIICDSRAAKQGLLAYFPKLKTNKIDDIYYGFQNLPVDNPLVFAKFKNEKGITREYILANGGLEERKNTHLLLQAFAKVKPRINRDIQIVVTGYNPHYLKKLSKIVDEYDLKDDVIFTDSISEPMKNTLIKKSICVINPSQMEGFGIPLIEAAYFHRPMICSDIAPYLEVGDDYPIFFKNNDEQDLSAKIEYFFKNREAEERRAAAKSPTVLSRFTYETMKNKWEKVIKNI